MPALAFRKLLPRLPWGIGSENTGGLPKGRAQMIPQGDVPTGSPTRNGQARQGREPAPTGPPHKDMPQPRKSSKVMASMALGMLSRAAAVKMSCWRNAFSPLVSLPPPWPTSPSLSLGQAPTSLQAQFEGTKTEQEYVE